MKAKKSGKKQTKKKDEEEIFPGYNPDGSLPDGWEFSDEDFPGYNEDGSLPDGWVLDPIDDSTITASKVAEAIRLGDKFIPQNKAEQELKDEIAEAPEGAIIDTGSDW